MKVLVTGAAGFIGMHVCRALAGRGDEIVGIDNLNAYYDPRLKEQRLAQLRGFPNFRFDRVDVADAAGLAAVFAGAKPQRVVHLAAQAGVRYSIDHPQPYIASNLVGFANVLEACRHAEVEHLVYASSSSVYGGNTKLPFSEQDRVDNPVSLYAATKKSNELLAHSYSCLHGLPATGLRFFTVYGPWGRPDMAYWGFTRAILAGETLQVFNQGRMARDFTYIDDAVEAVVRVLDRPPQGTPPHRILNVGNHSPVPLLDFIATLERVLGRQAVTEMRPMQPGDVEATYADTAALQAAVGFAPHTPLEEGLARFAQWYRGYVAA
jgi:UDP-glucuronate 4-epimerase